MFETGGQLVPGNQVLVGGQPIGTVDEITLTDDAQAEVGDHGRRAASRGHHRDHPLDLALGDRQPLRLDRARRRTASPSSPTSAVITADETTAPVDLDQLFNALDEPTRRALQNVIKGQAAIYTGNTEAARETYKYFAPGLQATERLLAELTSDQAALSRFLVDGSTALGAIAERRDDLAALTSNANQALGAIAARNEEFDRALVALPPAMRQANTTFVNLRAALDDLDPLIADLGEVAPDLPSFLREPAAGPSIPRCRSSATSARRSPSPAPTTT